jgi:peptide/nickel transport system permease protein
MMSKAEALSDAMNQPGVNLETDLSHVPAARGRRQRLGISGAVAGCVIVAWILVALIGPLITPYNPLLNNLGESLHKPLLFGGTWSHPFGTDVLGRDIFSRVIAGARPSAIVAFASVGISFLIGVTLGCIAGYSRKRWLDSVIMRFSDLTLAFPAILIALLLAIQVGARLSNVVIVLVLFLWAPIAKLARSEVRTLRDRDFIWLAVIGGASRRWIIARHILPNIFSSLVVLATFQLSGAVLAEAALSFLGAGIPPPTPAWGSMVADGQNYLATAWWLSIMPAIAIMVAVLALTIFGDALRDVLDPRAVEKSMLKPTKA